MVPNPVEVCLFRLPSCLFWPDQFTPLPLQVHGGSSTSSGTLRRVHTAHRKTRWWCWTDDPTIRLKGSGGGCGLWSRAEKRRDASCGIQAPIRNRRVARRLQLHVWISASSCLVMETTPSRAHSKSADASISNLCPHNADIKASLYLEQAVFEHSDLRPRAELHVRALVPQFVA